MAKPPFTDEMIADFERYQNAGYVHPYTCGNCSTSLKMDHEKLFCPKCDYTQTNIPILPSKQELEELNPFPFLKK